MIYKRNKELVERDKEIYEMYKKGESVDYISSKFFLSKEYVKTIIYMQCKENVLHKNIK